MDDIEQAAYDLLKKWGYGVNGSDMGKVRELTKVIRDVVGKDHPAIVTSEYDDIRERIDSERPDL